MLTAHSMQTLGSIVFVMCSGRTRARVELCCGLIAEGAILALTLAGPLLLARGVDDLTAGTDNPGHGVILVGVYVISWVLVAVLSSLKLVFTGRIASKIGSHMTLAALSGIAGQKAFDSSFDTGAAQGVLERLRFSLDLIIEGLFWRFFPLVIQTVGVVLLLSAVMPTIYVAIVAFIFVGFFISSQLSARYFEEETEKLNKIHSDVSSNIGEYFRNLKKIRSNGGISSERSHIAQIMNRRTTGTGEHAKSLTYITTLQYGGLGVGISILMTLAAHDTAAGELSIGDFILLLTYVFQFAAPLASFGFVLRQSQICIANVEEALNLARLNHMQKCKRPAPRNVAGIEARGVAFSYDGADATVHPSDLKIASGELIAIVGANGSGKSTLAKLIAGVIPPTSGTVLFDEVSSEDINLNAPRTPVVYAPQQTTLFNRTVRENLLFPTQSRTDEELNADLQLLSFEVDGRGVLDRPAGELGSGLSGGQVQKLEIVRIAGMDASVLVLDEITSALDAKSEAAAIARLRAGAQRTIVMVTHRRQMARLADVVVYMEHGRILAIGSDDDLAKTVPGYDAFWIENEGRSQPTDELTG